MVYSVVENIDIKECLGLFFLKNSNFYKFCLQFDLTNLKEVFEFFDKRDDEIKNKYSYAEIHGMLNILKYVYLNEHIVFWNKLNKKCAGACGNKNGEKFDYLYLKYQDLLRKFGFTAAEVFEISEHLDYNDTIGNAIIRIYNWKLKNDSKIITNQTSFVTFKKIELFANYYINLKSIKINTFNENIEEKQDEPVKRKVLI